MTDELTHYGTPRHSGRYPWGSGKDPYQSGGDFLGYVHGLSKQGMSDKEIATGLGISVAELRSKRTIAREEQKHAEIAQAIRLKEKGYSNVAIGERMGRNESYVRTLLKDSENEKKSIVRNTADVLKDSVAKNGFIDVGSGVERHMGIARTKLKAAVDLLKETEGYQVYYLKVQQLGTGKQTSLMVLGGPDTNYKDAYANRHNIKQVMSYTEDKGRTYSKNDLGLDKITNVDSKRVLIRYAEEGGLDKDGLVELRRGVEDISLGKSNYAQVRIGVDGTHYMKGMAIYADDIPDGYDMVYNTNKPVGTPKEKVYKPMKDDEDNPFGAVVRQKEYVGKDGKKHTSALNIVNEEGDWGEWSKTISSQVLSKQSPGLAKKQLQIAFDKKKQEYDEIVALDNPTIKKKLLSAFADGCDASAVSLKAAALPRQSTHVLIPFPGIKENEIYAPNYRDGEKVVLIRYPHGGIFEIPELRVNNKNPDAKKSIGNAKDAVGINAKVAEQLSGADFDGDTVLVIPNNNKEIKRSSPLEGLKDFDPKIAYKGYEGMPVITPRNKQLLMGDVSNLITDMTIKGASDSEIARAVRHSMVVIDSEKHKLNYKQSHIDNGIASLKEKYQGGARRGASTLISRASSEKRVNDRKEYIDPKTGERVYEYTNESYVNKDGKTVYKQIKSTKMFEAKDARELSSGYIMENIYADHANRLKALANESRKEMVNTPPLRYDPLASKTYKAEVDSLKAKLNVALKNSPLERQAQIVANSIVDAKRKAKPNMTAEELKKIKGMALTQARERVGAKKERIEITDKEWKAIQSGAISNSRLEQILNNTDLDRVKTLATPRAASEINLSKANKIKRLVESGKTRAQIADALGISTNEVNRLLDAVQ